MSIKSDKWIKKMSNDNSMIEPFSEDQIKIDENGNSSKTPPSKLM